jgi:hypothetical protein
MSNFIVTCGNGFWTGKQFSTKRKDALEMSLKQAKQFAHEKSRKHTLLCYNVINTNTGKIVARRYVVNPT